MAALCVFSEEARRPRCRGVCCRYRWSHFYCIPAPPVMLHYRYSLLCCVACSEPSKPNTYWVPITIVTSKDHRVIPVSHRRIHQATEGSRLTGGKHRDCIQQGQCISFHCNQRGQSDRATKIAQRVYSAGRNTNASFLVEDIVVKSSSSKARNRWNNYTRTKKRT